MSNGEHRLIHFMLGLVKKALDEFSCIKMSQYFLIPFKNFGRNINVKVGLSQYVTKADRKNNSHVNTFSSFSLKANLASLKTEVDILDIDKLVPVPVDLSKLSNVGKNEVVKKIVYDKLVAKVNVDTIGFVLKAKYNTDKSELEKEFLILDILLKRQIVILKLAKNKIKYQVLVVSIQLLH